MRDAVFLYVCEQDGRHVCNACFSWCGSGGGEKKIFSSD